MHALLNHLQRVGFTGSPHALGMDEKSREVLSYLDGECGEYPLAPHWVTEEALVTVATMLRMFHDAQYGFVPPPGAVWRSFGPPPADSEVICHHDAAPHNVIWRPDGPLSLIDFDLASPGARIYDVAYAAWTWVPLFSDRDSYTLGWKRPNRPRRLRMFADAYGLTPRDRHRLVQVQFGGVRRPVARCLRPRREVKSEQSSKEHELAGKPHYGANTDHVRAVERMHSRRDCCTRGPYRTRHVCKYDAL